MTNHEQDFTEDHSAATDFRSRLAELAMVRVPEADSPQRQQAQDTDNTDGRVNNIERARHIALAEEAWRARTREMLCRFALSEVEFFPEEIKNIEHYEKNQSENYKGMFFLSESHEYDLAYLAETEGQTIEQVNNLIRTDMSIMVAYGNRIAQNRLAHGEMLSPNLRLLAELHKFESEKPGRLTYTRNEDRTVRLKSNMTEKGMLQVRVYGDLGNGSCGDDTWQELWHVSLKEDEYNNTFTSVTTDLENYYSSDDMDRELFRTVDHGNYRETTVTRKRYLTDADVDTLLKHIAAIKNSYDIYEHDDETYSDD